MASTSKPPHVSPRTFFLLAAALVLAGGPGAALELTLRPGSPEGEAGLEIGDHLQVGAAGLAPGGSADLRLRDPEGRLVAEARVRADDQGDVAPELLWRRTGVLGCDCKESASTAALFRTFEEAELALLGTQWTVELVDGDGRQVLTSRKVHLETTQDVQVYFSDAAGCPRHRLEPDEDVYLSFRGPKVPPAASVLLMADRPTWDDPLPLVEVRPGASPGGEVIGGLASPLSTVLLWSGDPTGRRSGYFAAVVNMETARLLSHHGLGIPKSVEEGIVIRDWGCGKPAN